MKYQGIGASEGAAVGKAVIFRHDTAKPVSQDGSVFLGPEKEMEKFLEARKKTVEDFQSMAEEAGKAYGQDEAGIFEGYAEILMDPEIEQTTRAFIQEGCNAASAIKKTMDSLAEDFLALEDAYMRERSSDIADIGKRMVSAITGEEQSLPVLTEPVILIADDLSPFETVRLNQKFILAIAVEQGGASGHVAILSRSLGVPCIVGLKNISSNAKEGMVCAVNGTTGTIILEPDQETINTFLLDEKERVEKLKVLSIHAKMQARTRDGKTIKVCANTGSLEESRQALNYGADGIGLLRTELIYMEKDSLPPEDQQFEIYKSIAGTFQDRPVTIRTLDIGGDKDFPALGLVKEANPFLGYRAIRVGLKKTEILKPQLRAIFRAAAFGNIEVMFPLIISLEELLAAKRIVGECKEELQREGKKYGNPPVGIMVETPAAAVVAQNLAEESAFFSIGTNDLTQYTLAVDRGNTMIADLYNPLNPAVLKMISFTCEAAVSAGIEVGMCGELASDPGAVPVLIGLGLTKLSMTSSKIPIIKELIRTLDTDTCRETAKKVLAMKNAGEINSYLDQFRNR